MAMSQSSQDPPPEGLRESGNFTGPFDAATKDPKAQLQAILKGGGGLGLAFKLMKSSLPQHVKKVRRRVRAVVLVLVYGG